MKYYGCPHCGSTDVFTKEKGTQTGLYCGGCGKWIKWIGKDEKNLVERWIAENKEPIEQDKNVITSEKDAFNNLCKQIVEYLSNEYNCLSSIIISADGTVKVIETTTEINLT